MGRSGDEAWVKPAKWSDPALKLFPYQVGFTAPPMDFDAAPSDFLRIAPEAVGVHGRLMHLPGYAHELEQRASNLHLLEEVVHCMANIDDDAVLYAEWARHAAWRATGRLEDLLDDLDFGVGPEEASARLEAAVEDVTRAVADMRAGPREAEHYEQHEHHEEETGR